MVVLNDLDRYHLAGDAIDRIPRLRGQAAYAKQAISDKLTEHREHIRRRGDDLPEIREWGWPTEPTEGPA
jgi:xylulose-5-phosphate/fructose-6-phosphate phosphoketolase